MERARLASLGIAALCLVFWIVALAGLGALSASVCEAIANGSSTGALAASACSQEFGWQYWALFFQLFVSAAALAASLHGAPTLAALRPALTHFHAIAAVLVMVACHFVLPAYLWPGANAALRGERLRGDSGARYSSASALVAGWAAMAALDLAWVAAVPFLLDTGRDRDGGDVDVDLSRLLRRLRGGGGGHNKGKQGADGGEGAAAPAAAAAGGTAV